MALAEKLVKQRAAQTPDQYRARVQWLALIYVGLDLVSLAIIVAILWRVRFFVTLAQRSNVETLTILIIFVLAVYYLFSTWGGFVGGLRILWYNLPTFMSRSDSNKQRVERRKHTAVKTGGDSMYVCLDQAVALEGKSDEPIKWEVADDAGKLGELVVEGVRITYYPIKDGMNNSIFEFLVNQIEKALERRDPDADLQITQWSKIDDDQAGQYYSLVKAFENLEKRLAQQEQQGPEGQQKPLPPLWPQVTITEQDHEEIGAQLRKLVPALRNESFLPDLEYEVEYSIPVLPEPLGFLQLTRRENRADPVASMGCAGLVMLGIMAVLIIFVLFPPWVPSK